MPTGRMRFARSRGARRSPLRRCWPVLPPPPRMFSAFVELTMSTTPPVTIDRGPLTA